MPSTLPVGSTFRIDITNTQRAFFFGDTISGTVYFRNSQSQSIGRVVICLTGRIKTKIYRRHGNNKSTTYRGRVTLVHMPLHLYEGHYSHPPGEFNWPFSFKIPTRPQSRREIPRVDSDGPFDRDGPWISSQEQYNTGILPPSFNAGIRTVDEAFVEYKLEATLVEAGNAHSFRSAKEFVTSIQLSLSSPGPIASTIDYNPERTTTSITIRTLRLLPEHADQDLSFRQRTQSIFKPSSLPEYRFNLHIDAPRIIQIDNPYPIPFLLRVEPLSFTFPGEETNRLGDLKFPLPQVTIRKARIILRVVVNFRCEPTAFGSTPTESHRNDGIVLLADYRNAGSQRMAVPQTGVLDLSKVYPENFSSNNKTMRSAFIGLCSGFTSALITVHHFWKWDIEVECADKHQNATSRQGFRGSSVTVFGRARDDAPPILGYDDTSTNINGIPSNPPENTLGYQHVDPTEGPSMIGDANHFHEAEQLPEYSK